MFHLGMQTWIQNSRALLYSAHKHHVGWKRKKTPWFWRKPAWKQDPGVLCRESLSPWTMNYSMQVAGLCTDSQLLLCERLWQDLDFSAHWKIRCFRGGPGSASPAVPALPRDATHWAPCMACTGASVAHQEHRQPRCLSKQSTGCGFSLIWFLNRCSKM